MSSPLHALSSVIALLATSMAVAQQSPVPLPNSAPVPATPAAPAAAVQAPEAAPAAETAPAPYWTQADATQLLNAIQSIGKKGLIPSDYEPTALKAALAAGEGEALNNLATRLFTALACFSPGRMVCERH